MEDKYYNIEFYKNCDIENTLKWTLNEFINFLFVEEIFLLNENTNYYNYLKKLGEINKKYGEIYGYLIIQPNIFDNEYDFIPIVDKCINKTLDYNSLKYYIDNLNEFLNLNEFYNNFIKYFEEDDEEKDYSDYFDFDKSPDYIEPINFNE